MSNDEPIIQLLTEIRNNQQEEIVWRKKAVEESIRLQRVGLSRQRVAIVIAAIMLMVGGLVIAGGIWVILNAKPIANTLYRP